MGTNNLEKQYRLLTENKKVQNFIKSWQLKNDILNFDSLESFNQKFKIEFNKFLSESDFLEETINTYKLAIKESKN